MIAWEPVISSGATTSAAVPVSRAWSVSAGRGTEAAGGRRWAITAGEIG